MHKSVSTWTHFLKLLQTFTNLVPDKSTQWKKEKRSWKIPHGHNHVFYCNHQNVALVTRTHTDLECKFILDGVNFQQLQTNYTMNNIHWQWQPLTTNTSLETWESLSHNEFGIQQWPFWALKLWARCWSHWSAVLKESLTQKWKLPSCTHPQVIPVYW